jgi:hypothetical protein
LQICDVDLVSGLMEFGDITMGSNVQNSNNLKKVPRGLKIEGDAATQIISEKLKIEDQKKMSSCDKKHIDVYYSIKSAGVEIVV